MSERGKILRVEDYLVKKKGEEETRSPRGKIADLVKEINKDEFTIFKENKRRNILYLLGKYDIDEDNG
jgi:hypothetical protein